MIVRRVAPRHFSKAYQHTTATSNVYRCRRCFTTTFSPSLAESEQQPEANGPPLEPSVLSWLAKEHMRASPTQGTLVAPSYDPEHLFNHPPKPKDVTLELLLASESHFGASTSLWNPANSRYIFGVRSGIHIISLEVTAQYLRRAARIVSAVAERAGLVLFVGTRPGFDRCVVKAAQLAAPACHLFNRWVPGTITNARQIIQRNAIKVVDDLDNQVPDLDQAVHNHKPLMPDLVVCLNPTENYNMLHECSLNNIPTIGIIDTDADPTWVTYPIPANDDSLRCVQLIAGVLGHAGRQGQQARIEAAKQGKPTFNEDDPSFSLPSSFDLESYLSHRERNNKGQLRRDIEAKLTPAEVASLSSGKPVHSLQSISKRLRQDEIIYLRQTHEAASPSSDSADAQPVSITSGVDEAEHNENTLSDLSKLAAEASRRINQNDHPQTPTDATQDIDLDGDPWESPSAVVSKNKENRLDPDEIKLLQAKEIPQHQVLKLRSKLPFDLFRALLAELRASGRLVSHADESAL